MKILITGGDGYIGWPLSISLALKYPKYQVISVDNFQRRAWVQEMKSNSAIKLASFEQKKKFLKKINQKNNFLNVELTNYKKVDQLFKDFDFDFIINLAAQPSAPYSIISIDHCNFTQNNNNQIVRNILWSMKNNNKTKIPLIHTTTTGTYGAPNFPIPEGFLKIKNKKYLFGHMAGSWYHVSKCHDTSNLFFADKIWNMHIHDFRTAIVLGLNYDNYEKTNNNIYNTRFDYDFYFGVVAHRFIAMACKNFNLKVYGKGLQKKPFISLKDSVNSLIKFLEFKQSKNLGYNVYNQYTFLSSINEIAKSVCKHNQKIKINHVKNPRVEDEKHQMQMHNKNFKKIYNVKFEKLENIVASTINILRTNNAKFKKNFK